MAKALLKKFRASLQLWNAYAQIEWRDGNIEAARNVFSTALGMSQGFPEVHRRDTVFLWKVWIWEEICEGNISQAVRIMLSIEAGKLLDSKEVDVDQNISPAVLLKTRRVSIPILMAEHY